MFHTCMHCDNPATVHLTKVVDGKPTELHFCEECAPALLTPHLNPVKEVAKLLQSFEPLAASVLLRRSHDPLLVCSECGLSFAEFRKSGRFGCAHDYVAFGAQIPALMKSIHKADRYTGKTPGGKAQVRAGRLIDDLAVAREQLSRAIEREDYEQAARLRDEIERLAGGHQVESEEGGAGS